jgi:hypothetical protein
MGSSPEQRPRPPRVWISKPMQVFTIAFLAVCYIAAEVSKGKGWALVTVAAVMVLVLVSCAAVWRWHYSRETPLGVHRYPGWFGIGGYVIAFLLSAFPLVGVVNYLRGAILLKNLALVSVISVPVVFLSIWSSRRNRRFYRDVIVGDDGLTATVLRRKWFLFSGQTDSVVPWGEIEAMERSAARDRDSMSIGAGGPGIRLRLKDGARILILPSITGFASLNYAVESRLKASARPKDDVLQL